MMDQLDLFGETVALPHPHKRKPAAIANAPAHGLQEGILEMRAWLEQMIPCDRWINVPGLLGAFEGETRAALEGAVYGWGLMAKNGDGARDPSRVSFVWDCGAVCRRRDCKRGSA